MNNWISITDSLPPEDYRVLGTDGRLHEIVFLDRKTKKQDNMQLPHKPAAFPVEAFPKGIQDIIIETHRVLKYPLDFIAASILYTASVAIGNTCKIEVFFDGFFQKVTRGQ